MRLSFWGQINLLPTMISWYQTKYAYPKILEIGLGHTRSIQYRTFLKGTTWVCTSKALSYSKHRNLQTFFKRSYQIWELTNLSSKDGWTHVDLKGQRIKPHHADSPIDPLSKSSMVDLIFDCPDQNPECNLTQKYAELLNLSRRLWSHNALHTNLITLENNHMKRLHANST